jgi:hypothetical protein
VQKLILRHSVYLRDEFAHLERIAVLLVGRPAKGRTGREKLWRHLKHCNWALGSMSIISRRPTDGWPFVGDAAPSRMGQKENTPRVNDNWLKPGNGLTLRRESGGMRGRRNKTTGDFRPPNCDPLGMEQEPPDTPQGYDAREAGK